MRWDAYVVSDEVNVTFTVIDEHGEEVVREVMSDFPLTGLAAVGEPMLRKRVEKHGLALDSNITKLHSDTNKWWAYTAEVKEK